MADIQQNPKTVALLDHLYTELGQPAVAPIFSDTVAGGVAVVPGQPQVADAQPVEMAQYPDAGIERFSTLQSGNPGNLAGRLGPEYVLAQMPRMREAFISYGPKKP